MRKIAAAAFAALVFTQTVLPGGLAQTISTNPAAPEPTVAEQPVDEGYDKYLPTDVVIPTPEATVATSTPNATPTTTPTVPQDFVESDKFSYVFRELGDREVNELQPGEEYAVHLRIDASKLNDGDILNFGTEGMSFKDMKLPQMMMVNNLGFPVATFDDLSGEEGKPALRVEKIGTREEITPDFGWEVQILLPIEVDSEFAAKALEMGEPIVPLLGIEDSGELQLARPAEAQDRPLPQLDRPELPVEEATPVPLKPEPAPDQIEPELPEPAPEMEPRPAPMQEPAAFMAAAPAPEAEATSEKVAEKMSETTAFETTSEMAMSPQETTPPATEKQDSLQDVVKAVEKLSGDVAAATGGERKSEEPKSAPVPYAAQAESRDQAPATSAGVETDATATPTSVAAAPATRPTGTSRPMLAMTGASVLGVLLLATVMFIIGSSFLARPKGRHS